MAIIRCSNGHYYDGTKFSQCPHCGVLPVMQQERSNAPRGFSFFNRIHGKKENAIERKSARWDDERTMAFSNREDDDRTIALHEDDERTIAFSNGMQDDERTIAFSDKMQDDERTIAFSNRMQDDERTIAFSNRMQDDERTIAFSDRDSGNGKTMAFSSGEQKGIDNQTLDEKDYVVGWLVGKTGTSRGKDFRLVSGFNRMVYTKNGQFYTATEVAVDQKVAASVVYDDKSRSFFITRQDEEILVNGEAVIYSKEIQAGDILGIRNETFEFVAFCGKERVWSVDAK